MIHDKLEIQDLKFHEFNETQFWDFSDLGEFWRITRTRLEYSRQKIGNRIPRFRMPAHSGYSAPLQYIRILAHSGDSVKVQQNTWIDDRIFLKSCVRARAEQGNINYPAHGKWTAGFILRQNESRAFWGKYLNDPRVPWTHKRRKLMAIAGIIPVAKWLIKIKQRSDVSCRLCRRAREQRGASTENLSEEKYGHISSAFCDGMATTVTAAHHFIWRHLYASMQAAQTPASQLRFVTPDKESSTNTLWQEDEFE